MKILVLANFGMGLYKFRKELLEELVKASDDVYISFPYDEYVPMLESLGCKFIETKVDRRGTNPLSDFKLLVSYINIIKNIKPHLVLSYTVKPNVYGGIACRITKTPYISNVTGLGTSVERRGLLREFTLFLYKIGLKKAECVFFQNKSNLGFFVAGNIVRSSTKLIPGSGVNLAQHNFEEYPKNDNTTRFLFVGRMMKAKGLEELLQAAKIVKERYPQVYFELVGGLEEEYAHQLAEMDKLGIINYHGQRDDVHFFIKSSHATILPSYHEGMANVLLESASSGRPVLASRVSGCIETFDEGSSGIGFEAKNVDSLVQAIIRFIHLPYAEKRKMGVAARRKMEKQFSRTIVVKEYIDEISRVNVGTEGCINTFDRQKTSLRKTRYR